MTPRDLFGCARLVSAWVPTDVSHENENALAFPFQIEGQIGTQFRTIDVPVNSAYWLESPQAVENVTRTKIARVPDFIAWIKVLEYGIVEKSVSVGKKADPH